MKEHNADYVREVLEQMSTQQLDDMLQNELRKDPVDEGAVQLILSVLDNRDAGHTPEMTPETEKAWNRYQVQTANLKRSENKSSWFMRVASITVLVFALVATIPQEAEASGFFERIARWTESIFELLTPGSASADHPEYVFETDNPGLQEVYDTVTELGVTEPVVPMWLPEGYELASIDVFDTPLKSGVIVGFTNGTNELVLTIDMYDQANTYKYEKNEGSAEAFEHKGAVYYIISNYDKWTVIWSKNNVECTLTMVCSIEDLYKVIKSINGVEN